MGSANCKEAFHDFARGLETDPKLSQDRKPNEIPWYLDVDVDEDGCRKFPPLPPSGHHPRLLFTESEIPALAARHSHTQLKDSFGKVMQDNLKYFENYYAGIQTLSEEERISPSRKTLEKYFCVDFRRNDCMFTSFAHGFICHDEALMNRVKETVLFYARVIERSGDMARKEGVKTKPFDTFHGPFFDMNTAILFGGFAYALLYDLLYNSISEEERALMRKSISLAISGRNAWGMDLPTRRIQSNWAPYHGDLLVLAAAIEGEDGFDQDVYDKFESLMVHYLDFSIHDSGHPLEDAYVPNLGFREGSPALLVFARRGFNFFRHPRYINMWRKWMPFALEPHASGRVYGGASGSNFCYPTAAIVVKYVFPRDPVIDYVYRHYMYEYGTEYNRVTKVQCRAVSVLLALPAKNEKMISDATCGIVDAHAAEDADLPYTFHCPGRGKAILRSDWTQKAMWFTLDARGDCFLLGHDAPSRGVFVLNAKGRNWAHCPEWMFFKDSTDYSLPTIDGAAQMVKAPFVKMLSCEEGPQSSTFTSADITYAYNYEWTQWARLGSDWTDKGFEPEPHDPREFGMKSWWLPSKLYDEPRVGFVGLHQWRKRFNTVANVTRSALMVRASPDPFLLLCDNVKKDDTLRTYSWNMTTEEDVKLISVTGNDVLLGDTVGSGKRLVIRVLNDDLSCVFSDDPKAVSENPAELLCCLSPFSKPDHKRKNPDGSHPPINVGRLSLKSWASEQKLILGFFALDRDESMDRIPRTTWAADHIKLTVCFDGLGENSTTTNIEFGCGEHKETTLRVV